jgi:hypothetical protein
MSVSEGARGQFCCPNSRTLVCDARHKAARKRTKAPEERCMPAALPAEAARASYAATWSTAAPDRQRTLEAATSLECKK